jgi:hypothetical protein
MLPASATNVMPVIRIDHSSSVVETNPRSSLNSFGATISAIALSPHTIEPARKTSLNLFAASSRIMISP